MHQQGKVLLTLNLQDGVITSSEGSFQIIRSLSDNASATGSTLPQLSSICEHDAAPGWAAEATKGIFLDLKSPSDGAYVAVDLGEVCGTAFLAAARIKLCWIAPTYASSIAELPHHIQFLLIELSKGGPYAIILPLLPNNCKATLQPSRHQPASGNQLAVQLDSGNPDFQHGSWQAALYVAAGHDPFQLCDVAVAAAACVAGGAKPRWEKQLPEVAHYLGWCTWDAFYHDVSAQGIAAGLQSFKQAGAQPRWIIIDDGWQRTGLDSTAQALARLAKQQQSGSAQDAVIASQQQRAQTVRRAVRILWERVLRTACGWLHWRCFWPLLGAALRHPLFGGITSSFLQFYNRATSEHSKRLLSSHQFNAKFSGVHAGPQADTSTAATSAQVLAFVNNIKEQYGLKHVFAWHATMGYWSGVSPAAAAVDAATAAAAYAQTRGADAASAAARAAADAAVALPRVGPVMSDLEPPTDWSQLVLGGIGTPQDPRKFYFHLHSQLASLGITGVKVDVQNQLELVGSAAGQQGGQVVAQAWHSALEDSVAAHFPGNALINCMCHNTSDLYRMRDSSLARVSDDFYPLLPASHTTHVSVCAFNSLFFAPVVQPDWDMFHSLHPRALLHATARMISGGPVYVSDKPGRHDPSLLARLALPGGRLLQPLLPGRPCRDSLFADVCGDGVSALKVWNMNPCGGVLALFNVQGSNWSRSRFDFATHNRNPSTVTAIAQPQDVWLLSSCMQQDSSSSSGTDDSTADGSQGRQLSGIQLSDRLSATGQYVLYCDRPGSMTVTQGLTDGLALQLSAAGSDVVTVAPVLQITAGEASSSAASSSRDGAGTVLCAVVGLVNMLNPGGAVNTVQAGQRQQRLRSSDGSNNGSSGHDSGSWVMAAAEKPSPAAGTAGASAATEGLKEAALMLQLTGCGELLLYCTVAPLRVELDGEPVGFSCDPDRHRLAVVVPSTSEANLQHGVSVHWSCI